MTDEGANIVGGTVDKAKGRIKEAAGALADDDKLRNEGKLDQATGKVKDAVEKVKAAAEDRVDTIRHIVERDS
jgi:uncharacterized protein YjbJ (UPF0337 family)